MGKKLLHIFVIFTMILSMFAGIVPTPKASASTLGFKSASATDIQTMNKAGITDWKATVGAYDASTGALIGSLTTISKPALGDHTVTAPTIAGYTLFGYPTVKVRVSTFNHSPKVTFKYTKIKGSYIVKYTDMNGAEFKRKTVDDVALGTYTETAVAINGYEVDGASSQSITLTEAKRSGTITFKYKLKKAEQEVKPSYTVIYELENGAEFDRKTVNTNLAFGTTYSETAKTFANYELVGSSVQTVTLTKTNPTKVITFKYKVKKAEQEVKPSYTVIYELENGAEFDRKTVSTNLAFGTTYSESAKTFANYELVGNSVQTVTLTKANPTKVITFKYKVKKVEADVKGSYTVYYKNKNGAEFSRDVKRDLEFKSYTVTAKDIPNYKLVGEESITFTLTKDSPTKSVTFTYEPIQNSLVSTGYYTVTYKTESGVMLGTKTLRDLPLGLYVEEAREFKGYDLVSTQEQSLELTQLRPNGTINFVYKRTASAEATEGKYTVIYENEQGAEFSRKTVTVPFGTYEETAKEIAGFTPLNTTQKVTVSPTGKTETIRFTYEPTKSESPKAKISYTVIYKDVNGATFNRKTVQADYGTYTETAKEIPYYQVKGSANKTITLTEDKPNVTVTFEYEAKKVAKQKKGTYTVIYETVDGAEFSRKTMKDLEFGSYTEVAKEMGNYTLMGEVLQEVKLTEASPNATIYFTYTPKSEPKVVTTGTYTVVYKDENGATFNRKTVKADFGTYTETAKEIPYYQVKGSDTKTITITEDNPNVTVTFEYEVIKVEQQKKGAYTVVYETVDGAEFNRKTMKDLEFGSYTEVAKEIGNYTLVGATQQEVNLTKEKPNDTIYFTYAPKSETKVVTTGTYTVVYKDENGATFNRKTVKADFGTYTETAKEIPYYQVKGSDTKTITLTEDKPNVTVTFEYEAIKVEKQTKGAYTVIYETVDGAEFSRKTMKDLEFGSYTEVAKEMSNYTLVGATQQEITLTNEKPNTTIYFTYTPKTEPKVVTTGTYTVIYKDTNGATFNRKTVKADFGTYNETAKDIPYYQVKGSDTKTITITEDEPNVTVTFEYEVKKVEKQTKGAYTVIYESVNGAEFSRKTMKDLDFGSYTEVAKEMGNYTLVGETQQAITLTSENPNTTIYFTYAPKSEIEAVTTGTYTVVYKDVKGATFNRKTVKADFGTYTETAKDIPYYQVKGSDTKTITLTEDKPNVTVTFEYEVIKVEKQKKGAYTVIYETVDGAEFNRKTMKNLDFGAYTEVAKEMGNYTLVGAVQKEVQLTSENPNAILYFTYAPKSETDFVTTGSYTVIYKDEKGATFNRKTVKADFGTYTETAKEIPYYQVKGSDTKTITLTEDKPNVTVTFEYEVKKVSNQKKGAYTVIYETVDGAEFSRKTVKDLDFGSYTEVAKVIGNYTLVGEIQKEVTLTKEKPNTTIYFTYEPKSETKIATTGAYTVVYETVNGAEFNRKTVKDQPFGTYYETAKEIDGYTVEGATTKSVVVSESQPKNTLYFIYKPKEKDIEKLGSYKVIYENEKGAELSRKVVTDLAFGEYSETAKEITGYEVQGTATQKFMLLEDDKDKEITFVYKYVGNGTDTGENGEYTVQYVDKVTGKMLDEVTYKNLRLAVYTERASKFEGYTLASSAYQSVGLSKSNPKRTIVFDYVPSTNLCVVDFTDTVEFKGSKTSSKLFSQNYHFTVDPSEFTANKQYKVTVTSKQGIYNVKIQEKTGSSWKNISTTKGLMGVTLYSDCFDDKVFLKLSDKRETSAVPHLNDKTAITLKVSRSEQLIYKHNVNPFIDVTGNAVVQNFRVREIVYGTTYESFSPNNYFTRAHMFAVISRGLGLSQNSTTKFKDLKSNVWYYNDVMRLNYVGIVLGDNGKANATGYTTANQLYLMLDRTSKLYGGKGIKYETYFKGYKKNAKIKRIDAVRIMSEVFVDLKIITK